MNYSLALWWWASRWLSHIWVIKYIEEKNIIINEVSWTSMWAIIWAWFAMWKTSLEMEDFIKNIKFLKLLDLNLKDSVVSWQKVYEKLKELYGDELIENTKIPLKIIATNLNTQEKKVFTSWKIIDAVRSSISLPMIFKSFEIDNQKYIDWGLLSNLPVLELDGKNIIAVSAVREKLPKQISTHKKIFSFNLRRWFIWYNYDILKTTISTLMTQNENLSIEIAKNNWKNIILLTPDVKDYEYFEFKKYPEIIQKWYEEALEKLNLKSL